MRPGKKAGGNIARLFGDQAAFYLHDSRCGDAIDFVQFQ
jgi:hypothetical protein